VLSVFATFAVGGPQVRFAAVANHHGRAFRHAIVAMDGRLDCAERLSRDLDVSFPEIPIRRGAVLANLAGFRRALADIGPDVLVTHNWGSIEWAMANLLPGGVRRHVHIEDGFGPEEAEGQIRRRVLTRRLVLRRSTVVLPSLTLERIATEVWRLPARRLRYLPNGLDLTRFRPDRPAAALPAPGEGPLIGTVAALRAEKNLGRLLRAVRLLHDEGVALRLAIVGGGPERPALEALAAELGITEAVLFTGAIADPAAAYRAFDVFALSSDTEQMPLSVLEAMATGLPVAATMVGDVPQMVGEANRPFLCARDDAALAAALRPLLADAALRRRVGEVNRAKAEHDYDELTMFKAYAALLAAPATREDFRRPGSTAIVAAG
jgi:glycosyltransferase involved in cell wall biosynthesis